MSGTVKYRRVLSMNELDETGRPTNFVKCKRCGSEFTKPGFMRHKRGCYKGKYRYHRKITL